MAAAPGTDCIIDEFSKNSLVDFEDLEKNLKADHERQLSKLRQEAKNQAATLSKDQELEQEDIRRLREKITEDNNKETKALRLEIYKHCCENSFGFLHPVIGLSDISLEWYKVIQNMVHKMKHLDEFLKRERTERNIGRILPSNF